MPRFPLFAAVYLVVARLAPGAELHHRLSIPVVTLPLASASNPTCSNDDPKVEETCGILYFYVLRGNEGDVVVEQVAPLFNNQPVIKILTGGGGVAGELTSAYFFYMGSSTPSK